MPAAGQRESVLRRVLCLFTTPLKTPCRRMNNVWDRPRSATRRTCLVRARRGPDTLLLPRQIHLRNKEYKLDCFGTKRCRSRYIRPEHADLFRFKNVPFRSFESIRRRRRRWEAGDAGTGEFGTGLSRLLLVQRPSDPVNVASACANAAFYYKLHRTILYRTITQREESTFVWLLTLFTARFVQRARLAAVHLPSLIIHA